MRKIVNFPTLTDAAYTKRTNGYIKNGAKQVEDFQAWVANAIARYYESGDVSHLNNLVAGSLAIQRYRTLIRVAKPIVAHKYEKDSKTFVGKIDKDKRDEMISPSEGDANVEVWEAKLTEFFASEDEHQEKAPAKTWDVDAEIVKLIKKAGKEGVGGKTLAEKFVTHLKEAQTVQAA